MKFKGISRNYLRITKKLFGIMKNYLRFFRLIYNLQWIIKEFLRNSIEIRFGFLRCSTGLLFVFYMN